MLFVMPVFVYANCDSPGTTVIFINGVFGDKTYAEEAMYNLEKTYRVNNINQDVNFILAYNESHIKGLTDLIDSSTQIYGGDWPDYDLTNILNQIHSQLQTRKIILVGHSQGTFYTNEAYDYLIKNGVPANSITVYNVATPAYRVAGNGKYLNSSTDKVINAVSNSLAAAGFTARPLPPNITLPLSKEEQDNPIGGHDFSNVYLAEAPERIAYDLQSQINNLQEDDSLKLSSSSCFVEPKKDLVYSLTDFGYKTADSGVNYFYSTPTSYFKTPSQLIGFASSVMDGTISFGKNVLADAKSFLSWTSTNKQEQLPIIENNNPKEDNSNQITLTVQENTEDTQDLLDDIQERIDILRYQVNKLVQEQEGQNEVIKVVKKEDNHDQEENKNQDNNETNTNQNAGGGRGGYVSYPKLLISEVQILPTSQRFVEIYNPNEFEVPLTDWYIQRKDANDEKWNSFVSSKNFLGKSISANGFFLISDNLTLSNDNSLALKNPNQEISDKLGFGTSKDPETASTLNPLSGQSIGRKNLNDNTEHDTDDNSVDFEIQTPTPGAQNMTYVALLPSTDIKAPSVTFNLDSVQSTLSFPVIFTLSDLASTTSPSDPNPVPGGFGEVSPFDDPVLPPQSLLDTTSPSGLASYVFQWQETGSDWQQDDPVQIPGAPMTFQVVRNFTGENGKTYNFQAKATDVAGNESNWKSISVKVNVQPRILINQIQIASLVSESDEFVQLYNPNDQDVDLTDWYMQRKTKTGTSYGSYVPAELMSGKIIKAGGFLTIARTGSAFANSSDVITNYSLGDFSGGGSTIILKRKDKSLSDKVGFGQAQDYQISPAPIPPAGQSIKRISDTGNNSLDFQVQDNNPQS